MIDASDLAVQIAAFDYDVTPKAVPFGSGAVTLLLSVTNNTGAFLDCTQIVFTLPDALTADPGSVIPSSLAADWGFVRAGPGSAQFIASPYAPTTGLRNGGTFGLMLQGIKVVTQVGGPEIQIDETTANGIGQDSVQVMTVPPGLAITEFTADSLSPAPGQGVTLTWSTTAAQAVTLSYDGGNHAVAASGSYGPVTLLHSTVFKLTATGDGPPATEDIPITVEQVAVTSVSANPDTVAQGGRTTLSWSAIFADSFTIDPGRIQLPASVNSYPVTVPVTDDPDFVYTVTANGAGQTNNHATQIVNIEPVAITSFTAAPLHVASGGSCLLSWATESATFCEITPDPGFPVGLNGQGTTSVTDTTTFVLRARGNGHAEQTVQVSVGPIVTTFGVTYDPAHPDSATMTWVTAGGTVTFYDEQGSSQVSVSASGTASMQLPPPQTGRQYGIGIVDTGGRKASAEVTLDSFVTGNMTLLSFQIDAPGGINIAGTPATMSWRAQSGGSGVYALTSDYQTVEDNWNGLPDTGSQAFAVAHVAWMGQCGIQSDQESPVSQLRINDPYSPIPNASRSGEQEGTAEDDRTS